MTPLHIATARLGLQAAEHLLLAGADPNAIDADGKTAIQEVTRTEKVLSEPLVIDGRLVSNDDQIRECREVASLLRRHGAR